MGRTFHALLQGAIAVAIVVCLNLLAARFPLRADLTGNRRFTLAPESRAVLAALDRDVRITVFLSDADAARSAVDDLLSLYLAATPRVSVEYADLNRKPDLASKLGVSADRTTVVACGSRSERIQGAPGETDVTNAIVRATRDRKTRILFTSGSGERDLSSAGHAGLSKLKEMLEESGFACETAPPLLRELPDADAVAVVGPTLDLPATAETLLAEYVGRGGALLLALDPPPGAGLPRLLEKFDIETTGAVVIDRAAAENPLVPLVVPRPRHPLSGEGGLLAAFPLARVVSPRRGGDSGFRVEPFLAATGDSYAETEFNLEKVAYDPGRDLPGPVYFGVSAERSREREGGGRATCRVVAVGDADFLCNGTLFHHGTYALAKNIFAWLAARPELSGLDARPWAAQSIRLTARDRSLLLWILVVLAPASFALAGLAVHLRGRT